jgi:hypothetical protein
MKLSLFNFKLNKFYVKYIIKLYLLLIILNEFQGFIVHK